MLSIAEEANKSLGKAPGQRSSRELTKSPDTASLRRHHQELQLRWPLVLLGLSPSF